MAKPFKIDPRVAKLLRKGEIARKVADDVSVVIERMVKRLRKKHPEHGDVICRHLEAAAEAIRAEKERVKRLAREELHKKNRKSE